MSDHAIQIERRADASAPVHDYRASILITNSDTQEVEQDWRTDSDDGPILFRFRTNVSMSAEDKRDLVDGILSLLIEKRLLNGDE